MEKINCRTALENQGNEHQSGIYGQKRRTEDDPAHFGHFCLGGIGERDKRVVFFPKLRV